MHESNPGMEPWVTWVFQSADTLPLSCHQASHTLYLLEVSDFAGSVKTLFSVVTPSTNKAQKEDIKGKREACYKLQW